MTHGSNVCGTLMPLKAVGAFCKAHGLAFIVDSAQTAGVIPIDMAAMHIDALAFTGHKALLGPQGTGGFLLAEGMGERITPLLSGGTAGPHKIEGIGANFIPPVLKKEVYDTVCPVSGEDAFRIGRAVGRQEGILVGISSGAALYAAIELAGKAENEGKTIVVLLPDGGDRYLSTPLFEME